jgi:Sucrase/ferredoxin-like
MSKAPGPHPRCAVLARASGEPVAGTAPLAPGWVCLEHRGSWPHDITRHPDPAVAEFTGRATAAGWRVLLIRRHGRRLDDAPARVLLADTGSGTATTRTVTGPDELAELSLPGPSQPLPGTPLTEPLLLVCTHGRRDRCCALDGRALVAELTAAQEPGVWECSHLGGHRFAPTALVLPTGYLYGNLDPASARAARKAAGAGEVATDRCRGRSTWSPAGQVAELAVRAATGIRDADALVVHPDTGDTVLVTSRSGPRWLVDVERVQIDADRPASCGGGLAPSVPVRAGRVRLVD